ncbi:hypothetical protein KI387_004999, partial [Taxus chinensis]
MAQVQIDKAEGSFECQTRVHISCFQYGPDKYLVIEKGCPCVPDISCVENVKLETAAPSPTPIQAWFLIDLGNDHIIIQNAADRNKYLNVVDGE